MSKETEWAEIWNREYLKLRITSKTSKGCQRKLNQALKDYVHAGGYYTTIKTSWNEDSMGHIIEYEELPDNLNDGG